MVDEWNKMVLFAQAGRIDTATAYRHRRFGFGPVPPDAPPDPRDAWMRSLLKRRLHLYLCSVATPLHVNTGKKS